MAALVFFVSFSICPQRAEAETLEWNASDAEWTDHFNWSSTTLPTASDTALIEFNTCRLSSGIGTAGELILSGPLAVVPTLRIQGGLLETVNTTISNHLSQNATVDLTSGSWINSGDIHVGKAGSGTLSVSGGGILNSGDVNIGAYNSVGVVNITGGTLANTGSIRVGNTGQGTLNLNGTGIVNTDTLYLGSGPGGTGTLNLGTAGTAGTLTATNGVIGGGAVAAVNFHQNNAYTFDSQLSGFLNVNQVGTGITTLTGNNSYSGDTLVSAGTLSLGHTNALAGSTLDTSGAGTVNVYAGNNNLGGLKGSGNIANGGNLLSIGANNQSTTYSGGISGLGGLTKVGSGVLSLDGDNTYDSDTTVAGGTLKLGPGNALPNGAGKGNVMVSGILDINGYGEKINGLAGNGIVDNSSVAAAKLAVGENNQTTAFNGTIKNTGGDLSLEKLGTGTLTLGGANTYTGTTEVNVGTLTVDGSTGPGAVTVASGATLGGSGTIGGSTTVSGTHTPGNSPGLQTFESNLTYEDGATVVWELSSNTIAGRGTNFDGINVNGDLTINATTALNLVFNGSGSTVDWTNDLWATDEEWLFFNVGGTTLGTLTMGVVSADTNGVLLAAVRSNASFSVTSSGNNILVSYTAVPEPSVLLLIALAGIAGLLARRRKGGL